MIEEKRLTYAGYPISSVALPSTGKQSLEMLSLFYGSKRSSSKVGNSTLLQTVLKTVADHGPAVSGAHNVKSYSLESGPECACNL